MNNKSLSNLFKGDKVIWMVFFLLCMISITEVYSASSSLSYKAETADRSVAEEELKQKR